MNPADELASNLSGEAIAKMLRTAGPTVSCVLLRSTGTDAKPGSTDVDAKPAAAPAPAAAAAQDENADATDSETVAETKKEIPTHLISEIQVDTTPKKQMVSQILGGPFTFLGQYEDEGIVVIVRRPATEDVEGEDESDLVLNPHVLQPPLHNAEVYGDILLMRVAATEDDEDEEEDTDDDAGAKPVKTEPESVTTDADANADKEDANANANADEEAPAPLGKSAAGRILSNEEFFLDYTKDEYIAFASRTDIEPQDDVDVDVDVDDAEESIEGEASEEDVEGESSEEEGEEHEHEHDGGDEDEEDEEYNVESDEEPEDDEEHQIGMMNLILAQILKRFREENGRGPNTEELLAMRSALAEKLGIDDSLINEVQVGNGANDDEESGAKRKASDDSNDGENREKRVKFTMKDEIKFMTDDEGASVNESNEEEKKNVA